MLGDEADAEIVVQERVLERAERDEDENELTRRGRPHDRHPIGAAERRAGERQRALHERQAQCKRERELTELRNHRSCAARVFSSASATSGGM